MFELLFKYSRVTFERGEFLFASGWPLWLLAALIVIAAGAVGYTLRRRHEMLGLGQLVALGAMQTSMIAIVLVLAWQPALLTQTLRPQENSVAFLLDTSASMGYGEGERSRLEQAVDALDGGVLTELGESFDVDIYAFAGDVAGLESLEALPQPGVSTDIGGGLLDVLRSAQSGALGAVVLVSDGADNSARLDAARVAEIASYGVPVHTVGVGREEIPEDIELEDVVIAAQGLPGSRMGAQISVRHAGAAETRLRVYDGDAILASEVISLPNRAGVTTRWIDLEVSEPGMKDLRFTLDPLPGERNVINNTQFRPMEVPEARRSILYVEGEPRWEYKFMRRAATDLEPVRLATLLRTTPNKYYRQGLEAPEELEDGFPIDEETLFSYDALIIGSYDAPSLNAEQQAMIREFVSRRGGSLLMLAGQRGLADGGWDGTAVAEALPARLPRVEEPSFHRAPASVRLTAEGLRSPITRLDNDDGANAALWEEMPNVADFQYVDGLKPGAVALLEAEFNGGVEPLLAHQRFGLGNAYVLATGGTWRWQMLLPHEDQRHETFWRQLLQGLAAPAPQPVTLTSDSVFYGDESAMELRAEVRDKTFQPALDADVTLSVNDGTGMRPLGEMVPVPGEPGLYRAVFEGPESGAYRFEVAASAGDEPLGSARLAVRREAGVAEHFQIQQNRPLLERIAASTGGRYFAIEDVDALPEAVRFSDAGIVERQILDLWNMPFAFLLLLLLKGGEWLLRLFWGRL